MLALVCDGCGTVLDLPDSLVHRIYGEEEWSIEEIHKHEAENKWGCLDIGVVCAECYAKSDDELRFQG